MYKEEDYEVRRSEAVDGAAVVEVASSYDIGESVWISVLFWNRRAHCWFPDRSNRCGRRFGCACR